MLHHQGDNTLIKYQSCHAIVKQDDSHYMINLAPVLFENMTVPSWILPSAAKAFPASVTKKLALIPSQLPTWPWYVRMYDR
jgi:hypothetical protein